MDAGAEATLVVGHVEGDTFVPLVDGGDAALVVGSQGGWMVVLDARVPADWSEETCALFVVEGSLTMPATFVDPVEVEVRLSRYGDAVIAGTVAFFLGYDPDVLDGRTLEIVATVVSPRGRATARRSVVLRRA